VPSARGGWAALATTEAEAEWWPGLGDIAPVAESGATSSRRYAV